MFLASNIWEVSSGTVKARYCWAHVYAGDSSHTRVTAACHRDVSLPLALQTLRVPEVATRNLPNISVGMCIISTSIVPASDNTPSLCAFLVDETIRQTIRRPPCGLAVRCLHTCLVQLPRPPKPARKRTPARSCVSLRADVVQTAPRAGTARPTTPAAAGAGAPSPLISGRPLNGRRPATRGLRR